MSGSFLSSAPMPAFTALNRIRVMRLYRRALKLQMSWTPRYDVFRIQAMEIRRRFEENKNVSDPRVLQKLIEDAEKELYENRHPDPYIPPTAPGGSKWERNIPPGRLTPPNIKKDFNTFQTYAEDQRPLWQVALTMPVAIYKFFHKVFFPEREPTDEERRQRDAAMHRKILQARNAKVETLLDQLGIPENEKPAHRRWERLIEDSKREVNEWDWDAQFGAIEDSGDRQALYLAIFEQYTQEPRLRRHRFHREAMSRTDRIARAFRLPPIEVREFQAREIAIAAAHGHIGNIHYDEITRGIDGETMLARDKVYKALVVDFFIPHLEKFRKVIENRDDNSLVEQTRWFWQPKEQLIKKIDDLLALCKLEREFKEGEEAEWIYELYMAPKFYTEMERRPGAALEYTYWIQGPECVPPGYESPDEKRWRLQKEFQERAEAEIEEVNKELKARFGDRAVGLTRGKPD